MEARLLVAFVLMFLVLFLTPYLYKPNPPSGVKSGPVVTPQKAAQVTKPPTATPPPGPAAAATQVPAAKTPAGAAAAIQAPNEQQFQIETALYRVNFSNRGAVVTSWVLRKYKDLQNHSLELVNTPGLGKVVAPFSIAFKDRKPNYDPNQVLWVGKKSDDGLAVTFEYSDGQTTVRKTFAFGKDTYRSQISSEVLAPGTTLPHYLEWLGGFGDRTITNAPSVERTVYYSTTENKLIAKTARDAKNGPVTATGTFSFAGLEDQFFTALVLPSSSGSIDVRTVASPLPFNDKTENFVGVEIGGEGTNQYSMFVGPKDTDILRKVDPKLELLIDWGWFGVLAKPLFYSLNWIHDNVIHNYGWAIVLVTVAINMLTLPLRLSSMKSAKKMQALQPQIQAINARYKNLSLRDPKQQEKNAEVMDLYKKNGVNPLGGCLPMALQLPFFYAFYKVLTVAIELRGAEWLWVADLSRPETLPIRVLPIVLIATQFVMQKMTPASPGMDPAQQKMMMFMPLALGFMFYYASAGLVLYWLTGNLVGIVQQWLTNKAVATPRNVIDVKPVPAKKKPVRT